MSTLTQANKQWANRPAEERFLSLPEMHSKAVADRAISRALVTSSRKLRAVPAADNRGLVIEGAAGVQYAPTHWAFGQAAALTGAPAAYLRELPAPLAADCLNFGFQCARAEDVGVLLKRDDDAGAGELAGSIAAMTGPKYGRIWNNDVLAALIDRFGDGRSGDFRIPGEFGREVEITRDNTTLFAGDRDMFVFLADEVNRIELPGRRDGQAGELARGFFVSNSQVGAGALRVKTFLFDYVCSNRIVWGAHELDEIAIRHTASAPDRFIDEVTPALVEYSRAASSETVGKLRGAQAQRIGDEERVNKFLAQRFGPRVAERVKAAHMAEENRPIETLWDAVTGATAYAKSIQYTADRVDFETKAGEILDLVEV
jgi:hypothetical protein